MEENSATQLKIVVEGPHGPTADLGRDAVAEISSAPQESLPNAATLHMGGK